MRDKKALTARLYRPWCSVAMEPDAILDAGLVGFVSVWLGIDTRGHGQSRQTYQHESDRNGNKNQQQLPESRNNQQIEASLFRAAQRTANMDLANNLMFNCSTCCAHTM